MLFFPETMLQRLKSPQSVAMRQGRGREGWGMAVVRVGAAEGEGPCGHCPQAWFCLVPLHRPLLGIPTTLCLSLESPPPCWWGGVRLELRRQDNYAVNPGGDDLQEKRESQRCLLELAKEKEWLEGSKEKLWDTPAFKGKRKFPKKRDWNGEWSAMLDAGESSGWGKY